MLFTKANCNFFLPFISSNNEVPSFPTNTSFIVARDEWKKKIAIWFDEEHCPDYIKAPALIPDTSAELSDKLLSSHTAAVQAYTPMPPPSDTELENESNASHTSYYANYDKERSVGESVNTYLFIEDLTKFTTSLAYCIPFNMGIDAIPFSDPLKRKNYFLFCPLSKCFSGYRAD